MLLGVKLLNKNMTSHERCAHVFNDVIASLSMMQDFYEEDQNASIELARGFPVASMLEWEYVLKCYSKFQT